MQIRLQTIKKVDITCVVKIGVSTINIFNDNSAMSLNFPNSFCFSKIEYLQVY